ncbi:DNA ligase (ATP) [Kappamyces sp. JEL0829]|nr:DNA ligase (ATP) [Kappamyces sp. JEL0829]
MVLDWMNRIFNEEGYVNSDRFSSDYGKLGREFDHLTRGKHQHQVESLVQNGKDYIQATAEDPTLQHASQVANSLFANLFLDNNGNFTFKRELLDDFSRIIPVLAQRVSRLPLPGIEYEDDEIYVMLDDITLESSGLVPSVFDITTESHVDFNVPSIDGYFTIQ